MNDEKFKGITIGGNLPLSNYLKEELDEHVATEVKRIVRESGGKGNLYHPPYRLRYATHREEHGPVMETPKAVIHRENRENYFKIAFKQDDIKNTIVAALLTADVPLNVYEIKKSIEESAKNAQHTLTIKTAQIRVMIGHIMKSRLGLTMEKTDNKRARGVRYFMPEHVKNIFTFEEACEESKVRAEFRQDIEDTPQPSAPTQQSPVGKQEPNFQVKFQTQDGKNTLRIEGHFHFHFYLHTGKQ